jgi:lysophospholipase L1-like esterase
MERVVSQLEVDVVVFLIGINDLALRSGQLDAYDPFFAQKEVNRAELLEAFGMFPESDQHLPFYKRTRLWQAGRAFRRALDPPRWPIQDEHGELYNKLREYRRTGLRLLALPDLAPGLEEYEQNIMRLVRLAGQQSLRTVFLTHPALWRHDLTSDEEAMLWMGGTGQFMHESGHAYYPAGLLADGLEAYNARLLEICGKLRLECVDLAREVPRSLVMFYDDAHFTELGTQRVARVVARYLGSRPPFVVRAGSTSG